MARLKNHGQTKTLALLIVAAGLVVVLAGLFSCLNRATAGNQDSEGAKKAFAEAAEVLFHPRCLNCHPSGDAPLIRDDSQTHMFNVKRGPEGKGAGAMNCSLCHGETNKPGGAPGVANWHMPPENMPMVFQGLTPGQLCRQLKDPKQNGGRTGEQVIDHIDKDTLVLWGWNPGEGRTTPKMSHKEFSAKMHEWIAKGGACPE